jgi:acylphosphatase
MIRAATLIFIGRFRSKSFLDFVHHRAERLALGTRLGTVRRDRIEVFVTGEEDLIDAFEKACSLGPHDCLVLDHARVANGVGTDVPVSCPGDQPGRCCA